MGMVGLSGMDPHRYLTMRDAVMPADGCRAPPDLRKRKLSVEARWTNDVARRKTQGSARWLNLKVGGNLLICAWKAAERYMIHRHCRSFAEVLGEIGVNSSYSTPASTIHPLGAQLPKQTVDYRAFSPRLDPELSAWAPQVDDRSVATAVVLRSSYSTIRMP